MKHTILSISAIAIVSALLTSCSACSETEHTEAITAEITAAQMAGRTAAREYLTKEWKDNADLRQMLELTEMHKPNLIDTAHSECVAAFDSTFISTIRAVNPSLADRVAHNKQK